ncbi:hypothetical protein [Variovorax rhizosphaerae]|uniref:Uncharacterized protein n=1 Tax=Variovorax rhizosphaerae TaxID=1836200 RepID=A0ABU8WPP3_9BURK
MGSDQAVPVQAEPAPGWALPAITAVDIRATAFRARATRHVAPATADAADAVHIDVKLDAPVPMRALSPVLWVGDKMLTECEAVNKEGTSLRFWALEPQALTDGAPLALAWINEPPHAATQRDGRAGGSKAPTFVYRAPR